MAKRECIPFSHKGWMGSVELVDGVVTHVTYRTVTAPIESYRTVTAPIESCCAELRASIEKALEDAKPLDTPFRRLGRLEEQVRDQGLALRNLTDLVDKHFGGGRE